MRLLEKRTVSNEIANQKAQEAKKGLVLAKKVDAVRQTLQDEEQNLEKFRSENIKKVTQDIDREIGKLDALRQETDIARRTLVTLRKPLTAEWAAVEAEKEGIHAARNYLKGKEEELTHGITLNITRERENTEEKQRIDEEKQRADAFLSQANTLHKEAQQIFEQKRAEAERLVEDVIARKKAVAIREREVGQREEFFDTWEHRLEIKEIEQANKDREIADRYATLQRTVNRFN